MTCIISRPNGHLRKVREGHLEWTLKILIKKLLNDYFDSEQITESSTESSSEVEFEDDDLNNDEELMM